MSNGHNFLHDEGSKADSIEIVDDIIKKKKQKKIDETLFNSGEAMLNKEEKELRKRLKELEKENIELRNQIKDLLKELK